MKSDLIHLKALEMEKLAKEKALKPELFPETTWVDDRETLEKLGIHIPGKDNLPRAFLKFMPSDFIVEETSLDGKQTNISIIGDGVGDEEGGTVYATLIKCGLSTIEAVEELSKLLETTKDKIQYAGIKDKDALTAQILSFRGIPKERVLSIKSPHFILKDIHAGKGVMQKGTLKGNKFTILLRIGEDIHDETKMKNALEAVKRVEQNGFYNFFYLQRFGAPRLNNYKWALSILKGDYEKAIRGLIADAGLREIPYFIERRKEIISLAPNWGMVLERLNEFPLIFPSEIKVVEHLVDKPQDFVGALLKIEEQVNLWVSALASYLYNRKISSYIMAGIEPPKSLPLFTSADKNDWLPYADDMESVGIFPPNWNNLRPFRSIIITKRDIMTKDRPEIFGVEVVNEGIIVSFSLGKGEYATTFLSHFLNLLNGKPENLHTEIVDTKKVLGEGDSEKTLDYFQSVNLPKAINL
ncbi:MAG: tRNA pseudouridine13 synthase [Parcubacteria bacterium C7867-005]|nr:MAG: tRNA pseudouridine13 synthase [Parcubacteria bacterium C7867-005]